MPRNAPAAPVFDEPAFTEFFAADQAIIPCKFKVGDREAVLEFRPMDSGARRRFESVGFTYNTTIDLQGEPKVELTEIDMAARELFLVKNTLLGGYTWRAAKHPESGSVVWTQEFIPDERAARDRYVEANLIVTPPVWTWLVRCCERVNGMDEVTAKN